MEYVIETEQETNGRWIADVIDLPGVMAYGSTREEAIAKAQTLALHMDSEKLESEKEQMSKPKNTIAKFWGVLSDETGADLHKTSTESRNEWDQDI